MKFWYEWRILESDGRMTEPKPCGPYYNESMLSQDYESEEEAYDDWVKFESNNFYYAVPHPQMILVKFFERPSDGNL